MLTFLMTLLSFPFGVNVYYEQIISKPCSLNFRVESNIGFSSILADFSPKKTLYVSMAQL